MDKVSACKGEDLSSNPHHSCKCWVERVARISVLWGQRETVPQQVKWRSKELRLMSTSGLYMSVHTLASTHTHTHVLMLTCKPHAYILARHIKISS